MVILSMRLTDSTQYVFRFHHATNTTNTQETRPTVTNADHAQTDQDGSLEVIDLVVRDKDNHATASPLSMKSLGNAKDAVPDTCHHGMMGWHT
jgi:hypothetical protein